MFHNIFAQSGVRFDETLDDFVEVKGSEVNHMQYPGEAHVSFGGVTAALVVTASLKTAL